MLTGLIGNLAAERRARGRDVVLVDVNSEFYLDESNPVRCPAATGGDPNNMTMQVCVSDPDGGGGTIPDALHPGLRGDRFHRRALPRGDARRRAVRGPAAAGGRFATSRPTA